MKIDTIISALERVYGRFDGSATYSKPEVDAAEHRLGIRFPAALRALYERTGRHPMHTVHNTLFPPGKISIYEEHLVFYEESQRVCYWGISSRCLEDADPPVETTFENQGKLEFRPEFSSISDFLSFQAAWQGTEGALPYVGVIVDCEISRYGVLQSRARTAGDLLASTTEAEVRFRDRAIWYLEYNGNLGMGAQDAETFKQLSTSMGLELDEWNYATLRDEVGQG